MASEKITVIKGDSTIVKEYTIEGYDVLDGGWVGKKAVRVTLDTPDLLNEPLEKSGDATMFFGYLTPAETDLLDEGSYIVIYEIENLVIAPKFRRELQYKLKVTKHGIDT